MDDGSLQELFGPSVAVVHGPVDPNAPHQLGPELQTATESMSSERIAEFATGRLLAHRALARVGGDGIVARGPDRQPTWPAGFTGSITHTRGWCLAAAAPTGTIASIGVDAEVIDRVSDRVARRILTPRDEATIAAGGSERGRFGAAVIFAAKEAFYKAHHQLEPRYLGFGAISVEIGDTDIAVHAEDGLVRSELAARCRGRWAIHEAKVVVGMEIGLAPAMSCR